MYENDIDEVPPKGSFSAFRKIGSICLGVALFAGMWQTVGLMEKIDAERAKREVVYKILEVGKAGDFTDVEFVNTLGETMNLKFFKDSVVTDKLGDSVCLSDAFDGAFKTPVAVKSPGTVLCKAKTSNRI